jgi:polysaccharide export outer membrane protein
MRGAVSAVALMVLAVVLPSHFACAQVADAAPVAESLRIGAGDLLNISVMREPDLERRVRVRDSGEVSLPLVGDVAVQGLSAADAAKAVEKRYLDGQFLKHPDVSVFIEEFATQQVAVLGQVGKPGSYSLPAARSLIDVLAMAGGLTEIADRHITIERASHAASAEVFLSNRADDALEANVQVFPGDKVVVPKAGIIYVLGDVGRPGGYVMQNESRMTVLQAVAMAAGLNRTASADHVRLVRGKDGQFAEQEIPLKEMQRGEVPDLLLEANDVLYVPFSFGRHLLMGTSSIAASASAALIYAH